MKSVQRPTLNHGREQYQRQSRFLWRLARRSLHLAPHCFSSDELSAAIMAGACRNAGENLLFDAAKQQRQRRLEVEDEAGCGSKQNLEDGLRRLEIPHQAMAFRDARRVGYLRQIRYSHAEPSHSPDRGRVIQGFPGADARHLEKRQIEQVGLVKRGPFGDLDRESRRQITRVILPGRKWSRRILSAGTAKYDAERADPG